VVSNTKFASFTPRVLTKSRYYQRRITYPVRQKVLYKLTWNGSRTQGI